MALHTGKNPECESIPNSSAQGFTLVEALVASVILATLSAVAIPIYTGYIHSQRVDEVKNIAASVAGAAHIFTRKTGAPPVCDNTTTPDCVTLLDIFLPDRTLFKIQIDTAGRNAKVTNAADSSVVQTVGF